MIFFDIIIIFKKKSAYLYKIFKSTFCNARFYLPDTPQIYGFAKECL